jgi:cysteinyl-tRNA synthetase
LYYFSLHYRKPNDFEWGQLEAASKNLERIRNAYKRLVERLDSSVPNKDKSERDRVEEFKRRFINALEDDFNTPRALAAFQDFIRWVNLYLAGDTDMETLRTAYSLFDIFRRITGIELTEEVVIEDIEPFIKLLIDVRAKLREEKNYELADYIRDQLKKLGVILEDVGKETRYRFIEK